MKAVYALYSEPDAAQRAVDSLHAAGVADKDITIISGEPLEGHPLGARDHATWMFWIASGGGLAGLAIATWLTRMTETAWPLPTGNMPIVAWWPNLIVMFEMTMLGGILSTVITLLVTARIPSRAPKLYDPAVTDGKILVGVENPAPAARGAIERALVAGAASSPKAM
jgi:Alternative complex III, ActD subunit